jgi:hypothetical protein
MSPQRPRVRYLASRTSSDEHALAARLLDLRAAAEPFDWQRDYLHFDEVKDDKVCYALLR